MFKRRNTNFIINFAINIINIALMNKKFIMYKLIDKLTYK